VGISNLTGVPMNLLGGKLESAYRRGARSEGDDGILINNVKETEQAQRSRHRTQLYIYGEF